MDRCLELRPSAVADLLGLSDAGDRETSAYELLREAWALRDGSPRSSLLIAITALEVGVKQYIVNRVEQSDWLMNNLPAPDVIKLLREYLPTLDPPAGRSTGATRLEALPDDLLDVLRKRRDQRNDIAHKPEAHQRVAEVATPERATSAVVAVRQVLLRLDIADGRAWAREHLSKHPEHVPSPGYRRIGSG